jgi:hypothetical protein
VEEAQIMTRHAIIRAIAWGRAVTAVVTVAMGPALADRIIRGRATDAETASAAVEATDDLSKVQKQLKEILTKQEEILANQATLLQKFDVVMEELRIIKVRATIRGGSN